MSQLIVLLTGVTAIVAIAWLTAQFFFTRSTSRDLVWRTALVLVAIAPLVLIARSAIREWQWPLAILPAETSHGAEMANGPTLPPPRFERLHLPRPTPIQAEAEFSRGFVHQEAAHTGLSTGDAASSAYPPVATIESQNVPASAESWTISWSGALLTLWLAGFLWQTWRLVQSARIARRLWFSPAAGDDPQLKELNAWAAAQVGGVRPVPLLQNAQINGPIVCGIRRPRIILPSLLLTHDALPQLRAALLHEYGHIRRNDLALEVLLQLVTAVYWPHPLIHLMSRALRSLREEICDNFVLTRESPIAYSEMLLRLSLGTHAPLPEVAGLGMLSPKLRLESRIDGILNPSRLLDTSSARWMRRTVTALTTLLLLVAFSVRFERASAEPREPAHVAEADRQSLADRGDEPAAASESTGPQQPANPVEGSPTPREFQFRILSHDRKPLEGAVVTAWGAACLDEGGFGFGEAAWAKATSNADGFATLVATKEMDAVLTATLGHTGNKGIRNVAMRVEHPGHPIRSDYFPLGGEQTIVLPEPITITVRARREGETARATALYPMLSRSYDTDFSEADGVLTVRRVDLEEKSDSNGSWLRVVQVVEGEPAWFSDEIELRRRAGNAIELNLVLKKGVRVEGRLGELVPQGVRRGRVIAGITGKGRLLWSAATQIVPDGSFTFDSIPPDSNLQLIALCDGWISRSPTEDEIKHYSELNGFPVGPQGGPSAGMVMPQLARLARPMTNVTVPMQRTASCEVTVVDEQGKPLPDATVQFWPNQVFYDHGSMALGSVRDHSTWIRAQLSAGGNRDSSPPRDSEEFTATTNADGLAVVSGLPAPEAGSSSSRSATFTVFREGFLAISNFDAGPVMGRIPVSLLSASLTAGRTERITVRMLPTSGDWPTAIGIREQDASRGAEVESVLEGLVIDETGQVLEGVEVLPGNEDMLQIRTDKAGRFRKVISDEPVSEDEMSQQIPIRFVKPGFAPTWAGLYLGKRDQIITMRKGTYFEGTVTRPDGKPAANVRVRAWQSGALPRMGMMYDEETLTETQTDERGRYKLLVQPDHYVLAFGNSSAELTWLPRWEPTGGVVNRGVNNEPDDRSRIAIEPNEAKRIDARLEAGVDFRVRFVNSLTRQSVPDVVVTLRDYPVVNSPSDAAGAVTVTDLPAGAVTFSFHVEGFLRGWSESAMRPEGTTQTTPEKFTLNSGASFTLKPGMPETVIMLEPAVQVSGRVLDPDGKPVPMAIVSLVSPSTDPVDLESVRHAPRTSSSKEGDFKLWILPTEDRACHLVVHDRGWLLQGGPASDVEHGRRWANGVGPILQGKAGQKLEQIELRLSRPGEIHGRVVDDEGHPLAGVSISCGAADGSEGTTDLPRDVSDAEGRYQLIGVRPGRQQLFSSPSQRRRSERLSHQVVEVVADKTTDAGDLAVPPSKTSR